MSELNNLFDVLSDDQIKKHREASVAVYWNDPRLKKIVRMRFVTDPGFPLLDVSYCYGELKDGTPVRVSLPFSQLPRKNYHGAMLDYARRDNVFLKGLGVFNGSVISILF